MPTALDIYLRSVQDLCPGLSDADLALFADKLTTTEWKKRAVFLQAGKVQRHMGFIAQGLVRSSYVDHEGNEITVGFYEAGEYATHYHSFLTRTPSKYTVQCLEPTEMVCLTLDDIESIYRQIPVFEKYGRLVAQKILIQQQARIESFIFQTAEERYLRFIERHPTLFNRVSLSHLCSYLGIERQTLTRIRHRLAHQ